MEIDIFNNCVLNLFSEYQVVPYDYWKRTADKFDEKNFIDTYRKDEVSFILNKEKDLIFCINIEYDETVLNFDITIPYTKKNYQSKDFDTHEELLDELVIFKEFHLMKLMEKTFKQLINGN